MTESKFRDASVNGVMSLMEGVKGARRFTSVKPKPITKKRIQESYTAQYATEFHKAEHPEPLRLKKEERKVEKPKVAKKPEPKMVKEEVFLKSQDNLEIKLNAMQRQITSISNSVNTMSENTMVGGIGQGGDGQTPGSGEVYLLRLDDVDADTISVGQSLVWDGNKFIPGSSGGGGGTGTDIRISDADIDNWNESYGWGDHSQAGYIKTEIDPVFDASPARTITTADIQKWNEAHSWGDHALAGYSKGGSGSSVAVTFSDTEPKNPTVGMLWMDTTTYNLYVRDPSDVWVQVNSVQAPTP